MQETQEFQRGGGGGGGEGGGGGGGGDSNIHEQHEQLTRVIFSPSLADVSKTRASWRACGRLGISCSSWESSRGSSRRCCRHSCMPLLCPAWLTGPVMMADRKAGMMVLLMSMPTSARMGRRLAAEGLSTLLMAAEHACRHQYKSPDEPCPVMMMMMMMRELKSNKTLAKTHQTKSS